MFVRSSKFRHVYGGASKKEHCYEGIRVTKSAHDSNFCAVNRHFLAVVVESAGGGAFVVVPIEKVSKTLYFILLCEIVSVFFFFFLIKALPDHPQKLLDSLIQYSDGILRDLLFVPR
jgi:hypothetical protein